MILPFSTQLNGKPTYFVEKIWAGIDKHNLSPLERLEHIDRLYFEVHGITPFDYETDFAPKLTTIREDKNDRWHAGMMIDFFINNRMPNMFRFAPRLPCKATQEIFMTYYQGRFEISVDERQLVLHEIDELVKNDGFANWDDFQDYFMPQMTNGVLKRKLIHWTDLRY
jgi:hypothetical protein